jgi:hypothetical protein
MQSRTQTVGVNDTSQLHDEGHRANDLSDHALSEAGMVKISAFVRNEKSANARRVQKAKIKAETSGLRQVNVVAPPASHQIIKALASKLQTGCDTRTALESLLSAEPNQGIVDVGQPVASVEAPEAGKLVIRGLSQLTGWRLLLARLLRLV